MVNARLVRRGFAVLILVVIGYCCMRQGRDCLEIWATTGVACTDTHELDATWLWVNGSDPHWRKDQAQWTKTEGVMSPAHHYRESDELRYSMRSALHGPFNRYHLVIADGTIRPYWLDGKVQVVTHSGILRDQYLPIFESNVIESGLHNVPGLSPISVAFNDDFFLLQPLQKHDFYKSGPVFRFDPNYYQQVRYKFDKSLMSDAGEQGSLQHANQLLSKRFSSRLRPYLSHGPRVMVKHIHQEVEQAFKQDLHIARTRRFRESRHGEGSIAFHWLSTMWQVERWREAVIWSFLVARLGTEGNPDRVLKEVWATAECTRGSSFSNFDSMDGHLPTLLLPGQRMTCDGCEASLQGDLFANFAWENVRCGDCLIRRLVCASVPGGLSAVLPRGLHKRRPTDAMLPLGQDGDFTLARIGVADPRQYVLALLQRYAYSNAPVNNHFISITSATGLSEKLDGIKGASVALNDDVYGSDYTAVQSILRSWMQSRFPIAAEWERDA